MNLIESGLLRAQRTVTRVVAAMLCLWLLTLGYHSGERYHQAVRAGLATAEVHTRQFEDLLTQSMRTIELGASNLDAAPAGPVGRRNADKRLADFVQASPSLRSLSIADASGVIVASSSAANLRQQVSLGELFPQADPVVQVLRVGLPQTGRDWSSRTSSADTLQPSFVPVLLPLAGAPGGQWLVAAINPDLYVNQATQMLGPLQARVGWLRYDGTALWASAPDASGAMATQAQAIGRLLPDREFGVREQTLGDGSEVLTAYRSSARYPLAVAVHVDRAAALQTWRDNLKVNLAVVAFTLALVGLGWFAYRKRNNQAIQSQMELANERTLAAKVFDSSSDAILITTPEGAIVSANAAFTSLTGYTPDEVAGRNPRLLSSGLHGTAFYAEMWSTLVADGRWKGHITNRRKDGSTFEAFLTINAIRDATGAVHHYAGVIEDVTDARRAQERLLLAGSVFDHAHEAIMITDPDGVIIEVNQSFSRITGFSRADVLGQHTRMLGSGRQGKDFYQDLWSTLARTGEWTGEIWNRRKSGEVYAEMLTISAVHAADGSVLRYVSLFSDISQQKEHELKLERIAHFDALTGLPNRVLLSDRLLQLLANTRRRNRHLAVVFLDLDGFKTVNDRHGHAVGDQLLIALAQRMSQSLREGDTLARLGGDEFVAVLQDLETHADCMPVLERLRVAAAAPVFVDATPIQVSASLGVAFFHPQGDVDADQLLRQADQAMYQAKLSGKNRFHVFDAEHDRTLRVHHEGLEAIRLAVERQEFVLFYQPKVNLLTGQVLGVEALIRWQHPQRGLLAPALFLPHVENHPLALDIGHWVVRTALRQIATWQASGLNLAVSVNMDAQLLQQPDVMDWLTAELAKHPTVVPGSLHLEVLETTALEDMAHVSDVMRRCSAIGIGFSLDDFGTGYSSLTYLKRLPAQELKIDQSFIRGMLDDPEDLAILQGVLGLASAFQRSVIAEGVETVAHGCMLLRLGCEHAQGYAIARPMPAHDIPAWVQHWRPDASWTTQKPVDTEDLPLLYAAAEHRAWMGAFHAHVHNRQSPVPPLDPHDCRFGKWLHSASTSQRHGHSGRLDAVIAAHNALHQQAQGMLQPTPETPGSTGSTGVPPVLGGETELEWATLVGLSEALHAALMAMADAPSPADAR